MGVPLGLGGDDGRWPCHPPLRPGYHGEGFGAILLFAACHLPDSNVPRYGYVMENLLRWAPRDPSHGPVPQFPQADRPGGPSRYIVATLERQIPSFGWVKRCCRATDGR